ncbi:hypothetical protein CPB97_000715 [Podila verticillata]|nr:hypothetical protein CPB97_000715 [Podila verticillata]
MDILDIKLHIAHYPCNKDLAACVRLSRSWHASLIPTETDAAAHVTCLESLQIDNMRSTVAHPALDRSHQIWQSILRFAHSNSHLRCITFAQLCWAPTQQFLEEIVDQCPSLKKLEFHHQVFHKQSTLGLFRALTWIENVSFLGISNSNCIVPAQMKNPLGSVPISSADRYDFSGLKSFVMMCPLRPELWVTPSWIRALSSITRFDYETTGRDHGIRTRDVVACIRWPELKSLHLRLNNEPDPVMTDILGAISGPLERLSLMNYTFESVEPLQILIDRHAHSLTELVLYLSHVPSRANQLMMTSFPNLITLRLGLLEAKDILDAEQGEWACLHLRVLWIVIWS